MTDLARLLVMLALAGTAVTFVASLAAWYNDETRRITRAMTRVLGGPADALLIAPGRGRGAGFNFAAGKVAVTWDTGAWCLVYGLEELIGAELLIDGQVAARAFRGEARRALDQVVATAGQVSLRLIFDDPRNPDFDLDLWLSGDELRRDAGSPAEAIGDANRWLARAEAILRRPLSAQAPVVARRDPEPEPPPPPPKSDPDPEPRDPDLFDELDI